MTQGIPLDDVQYLAGHGSPRTTRLYDRRQKEVTRGTGNGDAASVRREKVLGLQWVQFPPGKWVAPAGSYRGGGGGNETVGAFETDVSPWRCSEPTGRNASER